MTGLTLGKFAPLHLGHQALIEAGIRENDRFLIMIYDSPEVTDIPLERRADWIRRLYPAAEVIEARGGPSIVGNTPDIRAMHERYILETLKGTRIDRFYSSEFYGGHVSLALGAEDCRFDESRRLVPISATEIRRDPFANRRFLHPIVYRDFCQWVVFLGAPSTGKTTICSLAASRFETVWMPEYGREYWEKNQTNRRLSPAQLLEIAIGHREREDALAMEARRFFFVDTDARTTRAFAIDYHGCSPTLLDALADDCGNRYDFVFLCCDDIPYEETWDRSGDVHRKRFQHSIRRDLMDRGVPFTELNGPLEQRLDILSRKLIESAQ